MHSPPLTPIRDYISTPLETSPTQSYREQLRRRTSSFSSNHDRSPITPRSKHRFSNASNYSGDMPTPMEKSGGGGGMGMGNLADELDQLDDEDEYEDDLDEVDEENVDDETNETQEAAVRDSGIDVSYSDEDSEQKRGCKPGVLCEKPPDQTHEEVFPRELGELMDDVARLSRKTETKDDLVNSRLTVLLQDLGNQATIEAGAQRLNTSSNSMSAHLVKETKSVQMLSASLLSPFGFSTVLDLDAVEESGILLETLLKELPLPDPAPLHGLQKLSRETDNLAQTLSSLMDTLQMDKQTTNIAARHLRTTQTMVSELRREGERADLARFELSKSDVETKIRERWSAQQCKDVISGFDQMCEGLRQTLAETAA